MLGNYKIRVDNEAESEEAQELLIVLGGKPHHLKSDRHGLVICANGVVYVDSPNFDTYYTREYNTDEITLPQLRDLVAQITPKEQGLISGVDAKLAWAKGEELEFYSPDLDMWFGLNDEPFMSDVFDTRPIRLKPRTISINNIEVPAPFAPKVGETYWCFSTQTVLGYGHNVYVSDYDDKRFINMGAWRTEDEIKQVVAALRSVFKTN